MIFVKTDYEEEFSARARWIYNLIGRSLGAAFRIGKKIYIKGLENRVESGANLILASHAHAWADITALFKAYSKRGEGQRQLIFSPNREIYDLEQFRSLTERYVEKTWGKEALEKLRFKLAIPPFTKLVSSSIQGIESVPFDLRNMRNNIMAKKEIKYLLWHRQRAVAILEFYKDSHSLKPMFLVSRGSIKIPLELFDKYGIDECPITMFATRVEGKDIYINIGKPEHILRFSYKDEEKKERKERAKTINDAKDYFEDKLERLYFGERL